MTGATTPVVVGVIDDGIAFAHERFRLWSTAPTPRWETRVEYWWLQDGRPYLKGPTQLNTGRELDKAAIDRLLEDCTHAEMVDEDEVYRRAGLVDFHRHGHNTAAWRAAHGTHVMDLACGYPPQQRRTDRPIVCVQLPVRVTADTSGSLLFPYVAEGMDYILRCAKLIAQARGTGPLPVVINLSYGAIGGPHDGTGPLEVYIDNLVSGSQAFCSSLDVMLPAGNSHLSRCHATYDFQRGGQVETLFWRLQPNDLTPSRVEIWLPFRSGGGPSRVELTVSPPGGPESPPIDENASTVLKLKSGRGTYCQIEYRRLAAPTSRGRFVVVAHPTDDLDPQAPTAPAGLWAIKLKKTSSTGQEIVQAWIQRDESLYGYPRRGRQSYFDDERYTRYDHAGRAIETDDPACPVQRAGLLNSIATGREAIVIGGYVRATRKTAEYSAAGPITPPLGNVSASRSGPDALAPTDDAVAHGGVLAAGSRSGAVVAMNGTSVATPQTARWIADERAKGEAGGRGAVKLRARTDDAGPNRPPQALPRSGWGRMKLPSMNKR